MSLSWLGSRCHPKVHEKCLHEFETWTCGISSAPSSHRASSSGISLTGVDVSAGVFSSMDLLAPFAQRWHVRAPPQARVRGGVQGHSAECTLMPAALACCHGASMRNAPRMNCRTEEVEDQCNHKEHIGLKEKSVFFLGQHKLWRLFFSLSICSGHFLHSFIAFQ